MNVIRATITSTSPLQVTYLGESVPVDVSGSFVPAAVGALVLVAVQDQDRIIIARMSGLAGYAQVEPVDLVIGTALGTLAGLSLVGMPTGNPMLMEVVVTAANGQSGGDRFIDMQLVNGSTSVGPNRRYALPYIPGEDNAYTIIHRVPVTPASGSWSLKVGCDQPSSVLVWHASLRLDYAP